MRMERNYWLCLFIGISLIIHLGMVMASRALPHPGGAPPQPAMEVALQPLPEVSTPTPPPAPPVKPQVHKAPVAHSRPDHAPISHIKVASVKPAALAVPPEVKRAVQQPLPPEVRQAPAAPDANTGGLPKIQDERPVPLGVASQTKNTAAPRLSHADKPTELTGGGAPAPAITPGGHGGASGPETPPDDLVFNGGGAGGDRLPHEAPRIGGGGGKSVLGVEDPLAKSAVPEERPGVGPGKGGGEGAGSGGGVGSSRGAGIGTQPGQGRAIASLRSKPGQGIGAGTGSKIGTNAPGGGHGTGAELPGTGGNGFGYSRGRGIGLGTGVHGPTGVGDAGAGGVARGVPFGDVAGLLGGNGRGGGTNYGPGGTGRGSVLGVRPGVGQGVLNVVYVLDCSGSMRESNKIGKAKEALKRAISELKPTDSFDVLAFNGRIFKLSPIMLPAQRDIIDAAMLWIDDRPLANHTNISGAMEAALKLSPVNCVYLMSDGEPEGPETLHNPDEIRAFVKQCNSQNARIMTLALCLGEQYPGEQVMRGLAADAGGEYNYINLNNVR